MYLFQQNKEKRLLDTFSDLVGKLRETLDSNTTGVPKFCSVAQVTQDQLNQELITFLRKIKTEIRDLSTGYQLVKRCLPPLTITTSPGSLTEKFMAKGYIPWSEFLNPSEYDRILRWKIRRGYLRNPVVVVQGYDYELLGVGKFTRKYSRSV